MDGQTIELDPRAKEALRQRQIYENAMASIKAKQRRQEAAGYAVMATFSALETASTGNGWLRYATLIAKVGCGLFAVLAPVYFLSTL